MRAVFRFLNQPHLVTRRIFLAATAALTLIATALSPSTKAWAQSPPERLIDRAYHGDYGTERQALHRSIVEYSLRGIEQTASSPTFTVLAGPMASGKSTLLQRFSPYTKDHVTIDIDAIRLQIPEFHAINAQDPGLAVRSTQREAGYIAELILWESVRRGYNVVFENSFRQVDFLKDLKPKLEAYAPKYRGRYNLIFVFADLDTLKENAVQRNKSGNRQTPHRDVADGYYLSMQNFTSEKSLFDNVIAIDNTPNVKRLVYAEWTEKNGARRGIGTNVAIDEVTKMTYGQMLEHLKVRPSNRGYDLYFDLDWSLFYGIQDPNSVEPNRLLRYETAHEAAKETLYFRALDRAGWMLENLLALRDVRIHFITGADRQRAEWLLKQLKVGNSTAFAEATSIVTFEQLLETSTDTEKRFPERYGKYVQRWNPGADMSRTLLIDDSVGFSRFGLQVLHSHGKYNFHQNYDPRLSGGKYEPTSKDEFESERRRATLIYNLIAEAYEFDQTGRGTFSAKAVELATDATGNWKALSDPSLKRYFTPPSVQKRAVRSCESAFISF